MRAILEHNLIVEAERYPASTDYKIVVKTNLHNETGKSLIPYVLPIGKVGEKLHPKTASKIVDAIELFYKLIREKKDD